MNVRKFNFDKNKSYLLVWFDSCDQTDLGHSCSLYCFGPCSMKFLPLKSKQQNLKKYNNEFHHAFTITFKDSSEQLLIKNLNCTLVIPT